MLKSKVGGGRAGAAPQSGRLGDTTIDYSSPCSAKALWVRSGDLGRSFLMNSISLAKEAPLQVVRAMT